MPAWEFVFEMIHVRVRICVCFADHERVNGQLGLETLAKHVRNGFRVYFYVSHICRNVFNWSLVYPVGLGDVGLVRHVCLRLRVAFRPG